MDRRLKPTADSSAQKVTKYLYFRDGSLKDVRWPTSTWPPTIMTQHTYYKNGPRNLTAYGQLSGEGWYHTSRFYNARGEMTRIKHRHSNQSVGGAQWNQERIAEVVYGLDPAGNPLRIDEYYDAAGSYHRSGYDYDALGRLIEWGFGGQYKEWSYDWVGNWLTSSDGTFVTDPDVDWLDSSPVPTATYDYNKLGALEDMTVSANTDTFSYDAQELLSQVSYGAGGSSTMVWDADQQRQKLTNSGGSTYFVYDPTAGVPAVLVETDGENETFYVREPGGELIARATDQTRQYYFFDRLGSTIAMVPAVEANPTDRLFYTPWGELVASGTRASTVGTTANPYRYVGELGYYYHHQDAGLQDWMQLGVRFYEPEIGRFERRDPELSIGECVYTYATSQPLSAVDPHGLEPVTIGAIGALIWRTGWTVWGAGNTLCTLYYLKVCTSCLATAKRTLDSAASHVWKEEDGYDKLLRAGPFSACTEVCLNAGERGVHALAGAFLRSLPKWARAKPPGRK